MQKQGAENFKEKRPETKEKRVEQVVPKDKAHHQRSEPGIRTVGRNRNFPNGSNHSLITNQAIVIGTQSHRCQPPMRSRISSEHPILHYPSTPYLYPTIEDKSCPNPMQGHPRVQFAIAHPAGLPPLKTLAPEGPANRGSSPNSTKTDNDARALNLLRPTFTPPTSSSPESITGISESEQDTGVSRVPRSF